MSMIGNFTRISAAQLQQLIDNPEAIEEMIYPAGADATDSLDVDKAWHGIHYLLTGSAWEGLKPLADVVLGGTEIGGDVGYGPARYLTPDQVESAAAALNDIPPNVLAERFDAEAMTRDEIYPTIWDEGQDAPEYLLTFYEDLRSYYLDAAKSGAAMLKYLN